jgi:nitroreductase
MIDELIRKNRSCRRFHQDRPVALDTLKKMVDLARLSASSANQQPLKYILSTADETNRRIFTCLGWAGYLKDWRGPEEGEQPSAYIVILGDTGIAGHFDCDHGIAAQSIMLGARDRGLSGCMIGSINRNKLRDALNIPAQHKILLVLAIGEPKEEIVIEAMGPGDSIKYWRGADGVHHVPKRSLEDIIVKTF